MTKLRRDIPDSSLCERFQALFKGYEHAHGAHELHDKPDKHKKIKGKARTLKGGATARDYAAHFGRLGT